MLSTLYGCVIALVPCCVTAALLTAWGTRQPRARHPLVWAIAGLAAAGAIGWTVSGEPIGGAWLGGVGIGCALIARRLTVWED